MRAAAYAAALGALLLTGCAVGSPAEQPAEEPAQQGITDVATGLDVPWAVARLRDGSALVTHRDSGAISRIGAGGAVSLAGTVAGVVPGGEGGLLGIAVEPGADPGTAYVYYTAATDNRVAAFTITDSGLRNQRTVLTGIPKGSIHNGGRIAFGPDGHLYVATGETGAPDLAQDPASLGGKILRITTDGSPAPGNPDPSSEVYSLGHRNVQGLAWDDDGRLWATEFGQSDVDELNLIEPGGNYGWPRCEGRCDQPGLIDPEVEWSPTSIASPSGLAIADGSAWVASLRGQALWRVPLSGASAGTPQQLLEGELGRLRDVVVGPAGTLWLTTSNTDGRGSPRPRDDRIVSVTVP